MRGISTVYVINIIAQAIFTLLCEIGLAVLIGWLATTYWGAESWIYVPLIVVGVLIGFFSMINFILTAMKSLENLEKQQKADRKAKAKTDRENIIKNTHVGEDK